MRNFALYALGLLALVGAVLIIFLLLCIRTDWDLLQILLVSILGGAIPVTTLLLEIEGAKENDNREQK